MAFGSITLTRTGAREGVIWYQGTEGGTTSFTNPQTTGAIVATASSIYSPSWDVENLSDRGDAITHTNSVAESWVQIDLGAARNLIPSGLSIRQRYDSTLHNHRRIKLEGSNDGTSWALVWQATSDLATGAGVWNDIDFTGTTAHRYFRITQTAADSTGWNYLVLSEIELYGDYYNEFTDPGFTTFYNVDLVRDADRQGVVWWHGTAGETTTFINPSTISYLFSVVTSSDYSPVTWSRNHLTDRADSIWHSNNEANSWWQIDLGSYVTLIPSGFSIRQRIDDTVHRHTSLQLQASNDGSTWTTLWSGSVTHLAVGAWNDIDFTSATAYRFFRVTQTGFNLTGYRFFVASEIELFGTASTPFPVPGGGTGSGTGTGGGASVPPDGDADESGGTDGYDPDAPLGPGYGSVGPTEPVWSPAVTRVVQYWPRGGSIPS